MYNKLPVKKLLYVNIYRMKSYIKIFVLLFMVFFLLISCNKANVEVQEITKSDDYIKLAKWITGTYSNNINEIDLTMYPIWQNRSDGFWIYMEQSFSKNKKAIIQRIYQLLELKDGLYEVIVYELPFESRFTECWKNEKPLETLNPVSLIHKTDCTIIIKRKCQLIFEGRTIGNDCNDEKDINEIIITKKSIKILIQESINGESPKFLVFKKGKNK